MPVLMDDYVGDEGAQREDDNDDGIRRQGDIFNGTRNDSGDDSEHETGGHTHPEV